MKKSILLIFSIICLMVLTSCSIVGYKECKSLYAPEVSLSSSTTSTGVYEFINEEADVKRIYVLKNKINSSISQIKYNDAVYTNGELVGEIYLYKTTVKYNESFKKAIVISEKYVNNTLPNNIYELIQNEEVFVWDMSTYDYDYYIETKILLVYPKKAQYTKTETIYDLSGSSYIKYEYA